MIRHYAAFDDGKLVADGDRSIEEAAKLRSRCDFVWLALDTPSEDEMRACARDFELHELAVEDAHHAHQRPKIEEYDDSLFVVLRNANYDSATHQLELGEVHVFLGPSYAIVVRHGGDAHDLDQMRDRVRGRPDLLRHGPSAVVYAVMDQVVDDYAPIVDELSADIDNVEADVFAVGPRTAIRDTTESIYTLKREVLEFRLATGPLVTSLGRVREGLVEQIPDELHEYFRDVLDHAMRVNDQVEGFRELLSSVLDANVALVSVRQNDIVQKISGWAAIIAVPTLVSGIYGMNFKYIPELDSRLGYPYALAMMAVLAFGLYRLLRRFGWL